MLLRDQLVQGVPDVFGRDRDVPHGACLLEEDEAELAVLGLLVTLHGRPGRVPVDLDRLRVKLLLDPADVPAGQAQRGEEPEGDGAAVRQGRVAGRRLERVGEEIGRASCRERV